jgi:hypothetical protein
MKRALYSLFSISFLFTLNASICLVRAQSLAGTDSKLPEPVNAERTALSPIDTANLDQAQKAAYGDVYNILLQRNRCSDFYGGQGALEVLNNLMSRMEKKDLNDGGTSIRMSGHYAYVRNSQSGFSFRLFDSAVLNANGPFYKRGCNVSEKCPTKIGPFLTSSREANALIILHELAHLTRGHDGNWLIPNDGYDSAASIRNSAVVAGACGKAIVGVTRPKSVDESLSRAAH